MHIGAVRVQTMIQQLMKDKKEALTSAKEVSTKLENEKKVCLRPRWCGVWRRVLDPDSVGMILCAVDRQAMDCEAWCERPRGHRTES